MSGGVPPGTGAGAGAGAGAGTGAGTGAAAGAGARAGAGAGAGAGAENHAGDGVRLEARPWLPADSPLVRVPRSWVGRALGTFSGRRPRFERVAGLSVLVLPQVFGPRRFRSGGVLAEAADLVVQPYVTATQSGISQIAFAFGKPVVATAVGGLPDIIDDGETGFLVPPEDSKAIAAAVERFFSESMAEPMRDAIMASRERFSWSSMARCLTSS